jgi:hypothetical protein
MYVILSQLSKALEISMQPLRRKLASHYQTQIKSRNGF